MQRVYFYPASYLRDRQLDTIRRWPADRVVNPEVALNRRGKQVTSSYAISLELQVSLKQKLPLMNLKLRPKSAPHDSIVYVWGAIIATGPFIVDLDNPWSLVGYNLRAMQIYRPLIRRSLLSARCLEIRCMSEACRLSMKSLFGDEVFKKANVHYPCIPQVVTEIPVRHMGDCRFLFVGTQFEIKGGVALLQAFRSLYDQTKNVRLDVVTHLPVEYLYLVEGCPAIHIHDARFTRNEIHEQFMLQADVLVLPTYVESFGMVALEALAHGLALIATDVYAISELLVDGINGHLLEPPISIWNEYTPSSLYLDLQNAKHHIRALDTTDFEKQLKAAMMHFACDADWTKRAREASVQLMTERFAC